MKSSMQTEWPNELYHQKPGRPSGTGNPLRRTHRPKLENAEFLAWDGEGYTDANGRHHYMLFGNSDGEYVQSVSLDWQDCFPLLVAHPNVINIIYGGDYDIIKMIQTIPIDSRRRIMHGKWTLHGDYSIQWIRRKMLHIKQVSTGQTVTLYDVLPFFQTSFVNACREYLGNDQILDEMYAMKLQRDQFTYDDPNVIPYWQSELKYLVTLMSCFRELLSEVDIVPSKGWYGPGAIANRLMRNHDMRRFYGDIPNVVNDLAERAYYGGRFEQFKIGRFENAYEFDIRSAYPAAIAQLPDFSDAQWIHSDEFLPFHPNTVNKFGLYCVSWNVEGTGRSVGPFPWRSAQGNIYFPLTGHRSWYWGIELIAALQVYAKWIEVHEYWIPFLDSDVKPFTWVPEMYDRRAKMRAEDNPAQKGLKLGLNSLYGKVAQSIGAVEKEGRWRKPTWHHALWAGWITAYCRATIFQAIGNHHERLIAIETDAVFVTEPIDGLTIGEGLGEWESTYLDSILYVRSGIYHAITDHGVRKLKSRGIESSYVYDEDYWLEVFKKLPHEEVTITTRARRFGTDLRQPWRFGQWYSQSLSVTLPNTFGKRVHLPSRCRACKRGESYAERYHDLVVPQPFIESEWQESTPYKFPWRSDVKYRWPSIVKGEHIERMADIQWQ